MTTQLNTPEQPKREAWEEKMMELAHLPEPNVLSLQYWAVRCVVDVALSTQSAELERAIVDKEAMQEERNDVQSTLDDTRKELERVKANERELAEGVLRLTADLRYIDGIVTRGTGVEIRDDESVRGRILAYVKKLESELAAVREKVNEMEAEYELSFRMLEANGRDTSNVERVLERLERINALFKP